MGVIHVAPRARAMPRPPPWFAEEVELFARKSGRTATARLVPTLFQGHRMVRWTWVVDIELKPNDPRMEAWKQGRAEKPPKEEVWIHVRNPKEGQVIPGTHGLREPPFIGLDIHQLGASGVKDFLEKGDTWSGRGQFRSITEAAKKAGEHNADHRQRVKAEAREENRLERREERRHRLGIPLLPVGIDLKRKKKEKSE